MSDDLTIANIDLAEEMYEKYLSDKQSVNTSWQTLFSGLEMPSKKFEGVENQDLKIQRLIDAYRKFGHLVANVNPLETSKKESEFLKVNESNLHQMYPTCGLLNKPEASLLEIIETLKHYYCSSIGFEYMGLSNPALEKFIQTEVEKEHEISLEQKKMILHHLNRSELLELFLHTKYVGQKRFSLEGAETLIPMLEAAIETGSETGIDEFFIGMSHRGRLNVLSNILKKSYTELFSEFDENYLPNSIEGGGDVKYHKGFSSEIITTNKKNVKITLTPNPSHLESVDAVVEGQTKARQISKQDEVGVKVLPILVHGDAAISGQGIVYEILQFCKLPGYSTGGTLHLVVNNQIGFTTVPRDARSTFYCTDIAKTFGAPVFHVNGDDPESAVFALNLSLKIRQKFHIDVFIDLICYRKFGHNETDEPAFTQPLEYQVIRQKKPVRELYRDSLIQQGFLEKELAIQLETEFKESLQVAQKAVKSASSDEPNLVLKKENTKTVDTAVSKNVLNELAVSFCKVPNDFNIHPKVADLLKKRLQMVEEEKNIDWGMAELLSYASLLVQGVNVRLSGQDSCRGTFSHRHGVLVDQVKERDYFPLKHLSRAQGRFDLLNSPLSEFAVLGFEYGYNIININDLCIWEAQFGDFANGAQVMIDQYIASAEQKWGQKSSLVLLLPHGYEGQGPEHSSGRIERFLNLAANNNMQIVNPTTPAQFFHLIRRQILGKMDKPLIIFTPKGLLRYPECVSLLSDLTTGHFETILESGKGSPKNLIFCSGRIYYDLIKQNFNDVKFVRIEQLYPLDLPKLKEILDKGFKKAFFVQEEPCNMGALEYIKGSLNELMPQGILKCIGRKRSASPASGSLALHKREYAEMMDTLVKEIV